MDGGVIAQVGTPRKVYDNPATDLVAGFIGSTAMNSMTWLLNPSDIGAQ